MKLRLRIWHMVIAAFGIPMCVLMTATGHGGPAQIMKTCLHIGIFAFVLRGVLRWDVTDFVLGLLGTGGIAFVIMAFLGGVSWIGMLERDPLLGLLIVCLGVAAPWFLGFGLGSLWLSLSKRRREKVEEKEHSTSD
jgi:hypothetical protein